MIVFVLFVTLSGLASAKDDERWVWDNNNRDTSARLNYERVPRYEVYEHERPFRPSEPYYERPPYRPDLSPISRPGGVYGSVSSGTYGPNHHYPSNPNNPEPEILTGPIPSWVKEGPFKNYDKCKCTEKFNCNTPGISYGHCDVGKQYCCYATKKQDQIGGPLPSRPHHSIDNGILVGPGGPVDSPRPGALRPVRPGGFGLGGGGRGENGILVGPGGPFDRPAPVRQGGGYGFARTTKN